MRKSREVFRMVSIWDKSLKSSINTCPPNQVVLVDEEDIPQGACAKLDAHKNGGALHRAFSIFILNEECKILLQQRAHSKYHCPGLWSNSCCSHPHPGKVVLEEAVSRLQFELGFTTDLFHIGTCIYRVSVDNGLTEWELDHIFVGDFSGKVSPNSEEVAEVRWIALVELQDTLVSNLSAFTPWLPYILPTFTDWFINKQDRQTMSSTQSAYVTKKQP